MNDELGRNLCQAVKDGDKNRLHDLLNVLYAHILSVSSQESESSKIRRPSASSQDEALHVERQSMKFDIEKHPLCYQENNLLWTPFHLAVSLANIEALEQLIKFAIDKNVRVSPKGHPIRSGVDYGNYFEILYYSISPIEMTDVLGQTCLHLAAEMGSLPLVKLILDLSSISLQGRSCSIHSPSTSPSLRSMSGESDADLTSNSSVHIKSASSILFMKDIYGRRASDIVLHNYNASDRGSSQKELLHFLMNKEKTLLNANEMNRIMVEQGILQGYLYKMGAKGLVKSYKRRWFQMA